jgi:glycosyltransferase involved in cell wall biosynthesis
VDLVSVVIPAYNRANVIEEAIRSVQSQTYQDYEILVVDDGSSDSTPRILKRLTQEDARIKYLQHPTNLGAQAARNTGIRASKGRWIAFLDSDDRWLPQSLKARLGLALQSRKEVIHSECLVLTTDGEARLYGTPRLVGRVYKKLLTTTGPTFPSLLVSKESLVRIGYLDENIPSHQEWDTVIRLARHYEFEFVTEPTFVYDCRHSDTISKNRVREAIGYERVFTKHCWQVARHVGVRAVIAHYQTAAELYRRAQDNENAKRCLKRAFLWWPFRPRTIWNCIKRAPEL